MNLPSGEKETYIITLPRLVIAGLLVGSPYIELSQTSYIASSTGYVSTVSTIATSLLHLSSTLYKIDYSGKGYFSGAPHTFKANVTNPLLTSTMKLYTFEGQWNTTSKNSKTGEEFTNVKARAEEAMVVPVDKQDEWESRKLWQEVAKGIRTGDFNLASREKSRIENEQRQRRRDEAAKGEKWQLKHFVKVESDPECKH